MRKRTVGVVVVLVVVAVLSLGIVATASATPSLTSVSPSSGNTNYGGSIELKIYGQNLSDFLGAPDVYLEQSNWPYDDIYASSVYVVSMLGGDYIDCYVTTYGETPGAYDVNVTGTWLLGQPPTTLTLSSAFTVTGTSPVTTPTIASIRPTSATAGGAAFTLTVNGSNFATGTLPAVINWNGTALATSSGVINPTAVLNATVPASYIASPGIALITVTNPMPGGGTTSNSVAFYITQVLPTLTGLNPSSTWAKYVTPPLVTLTGTNFQSGAQVLVNGVVHASSYGSTTTMTVQLTAADIANAGTLNFAVRNSASGSVTATLPFTLTADTTTPVTTISGADTLWHNTPVTLTVTATDAGGPGVQKTYYGIGITPSIVLVGSTITVPAPAGGGGDGAQLVQAYSVDNCNNSEVPPASATVNICTQGPSTDAFAPASVVKGKKLKIGYQADSITPTCNIVIKIFKSNNTVAKNINVGQKASNQQGNYSFTCNLNPGKYKVKVYATDAAGNAQSSMSGDSFQVTK